MDTAMGTVDHADLLQWTAVFFAAVRGVQLLAKTGARKHPSAAGCSEEPTQQLRMLFGGASLSFSIAPFL